MAKSFLLRGQKDKWRCLGWLATKNTRSNNSKGIKTKTIN